MRDVIHRLAQLPGPELHQEALRARASQALSDYQLAACLLVAERSGWARYKGWGSAVQYGVHELELEAAKAADLLRAARLLEGLPLLSEAFRAAKVGWGKIRAITRIVTPDTEREWLEAALACTTEQLARQVALSPREWKRRAQEETASAAEMALDFEAPHSTSPAPGTQPPTKSAAPGAAEPGESDAAGPGAPGPGAAGPGASGAAETSRAPRTAAASRPAGTTRPTGITVPVEPAGPEPPETIVPAEPAGDSIDGYRGPNLTTEAHASGGARAAGPIGGPAPRGGRPTTDTSGDGRRDGPKGPRRPPLPGPRLIRVTLLFTPEQYAIYEKAQQRISNKRRRKVGREEATAEMARHTLDAAPERSRSRHQVVVHLDAATELAWIETERGLHTLTDEQRDAVLSEGRVFVTTSGIPQRMDVGRTVRTEGEQSDRGRSGQTGGEASDPFGVTRRENSDPGSDPAGPAAWSGQGLLDLEKERRPKLRAQVPLPTLRALFARAKGRCERCNGSQGLQVHHRTPRSRGGTHDLELLLLLCDRCHGVGHDQDFASDQTWEKARTRARRRSRRKSPG